MEGKEAFTLTEAQKQALKQAGFTDAEIEGIEKEIAKHKLDDANFDAEDFLNKKLAEKNLQQKKQMHLEFLKKRHQKR